MGIAIILTLAFSGAQGRNPAGFNPDEPVVITAWAPKGTTFVAGFNALLNILFTWVGQIVYPVSSACTPPPCLLPLTRMLRLSLPALAVLHRRDEAA